MSAQRRSRPPMQQSGAHGVRRSARWLYVWLRGLPRMGVGREHLELGTKKDNRKDFMQRHPRAMELCIEASKQGAKGVKKFWQSMTKEERKQLFDDIGFDKKQRKEYE